MLNELMVYEHREKAVVSSRVVAERFKKEHKTVLKIIGGEKRNEKLISGLIEQISSGGNPPHLYFINSTYLDSYGREQKEYLCTRDGFSLLAMGFTGKSALEWKLKYIETFNKMEAFIKERQSTEWLQTRKQGKLIRRGETDVLQNLIAYAIKQGSDGYKRTPTLCYKHYSTLVNDLVGIQSGQREFIDFKTLSALTFLEDMIMETCKEEMSKGTHYKEIYKLCKSKGNELVKYMYLKPHLLK